MLLLFIPDRAKAYLPGICIITQRLNTTTVL